MEQKCRQCNTELQLGNEVIAVQVGVIGPRGFVELEEIVFVCNETCARKYFDDADVVKLQRRIP